MCGQVKTCFKCGVEKPLSEFYRHPQMGDGHLGKCKACTRRDVYLNRLAKIDHYQEYDRKRFAETWHRRICSASWLHSDREANREKHVARSAVIHAIRDGRLRRGPCEVCGCVEVQGHHDDYSKPLEVRWLCVKHHFEAHRKYDDNYQLREANA